MPHEGKPDADIPVAQARQLEAEFGKRLRELQGDIEKFEAQYPGWAKILPDLQARSVLIHQALELLPEHVHKEHRLSLAVTDVFVAKAQHILEDRAAMLWQSGRSCFKMGICASLLTIAVMLLHEPPVEFKDDQVFVAFLVRSGSVVAFAAVIVTQLFQRAFKNFHEAAVDLHRRHSMRFGRLFVYLTREDKPTLKNLKDAFDWNAQPTTAFAKHNVTVNSPMAAVTTVPSKILTDARKLLKASKQPRKNVTAPAS